MSGRTEDMAMSVLQLRGMLDGMSCFHGLMPSNDCEDLLKEVGDFMVRVSTETQRRPTAVLSVMTHQRRVYSIPIEQTADVRFRLRGEAELLFDNVPALVDDYIGTSRVVYGCMEDGQSITFSLLLGVDRPPWHLAHADLEIKQQMLLGLGKLGNVFVGVLRVGDHGGCRTVAVKRSERREEDYKEFMCEARIMRNHEHANLVRLIGVVLDYQPPYLVMEYCGNGSLLTHLCNCRTLKQLSALQRNTYLLHVAMGMRYLAKGNILHNNLSANNCLLDDDYTVCKVGDMQLARLHTGDAVLHLDPTARQHIPWLAPEVHTTGWTTPTSDTWSYGVLVWEMYDGGDMNYSPLPVPLHDYAELKPNEMMPSNMRRTMRDCLREKPGDRPDFLELKTTMRKRSHSFGIRHLSRAFLDRCKGGKSDGPP